MRRRALPLLALLSSLSLSAQESPTPAVLPNLKIPVELNNSVRSDKAHPGDKVKLHMAEPILAGKGVVIPRNAKLSGRIVRAGLGRSGKRWVLSMLLEKAEWKGHVVALNAFVTGWGKRQLVRSNLGTCDSIPNMIPTRPRRGLVTSTMNTSTPGTPDCPAWAEQPDLRQYSYSRITADIEIFRSPSDGSTVLVSKKNIYLPSGMLLVFQNVDDSSLSAEATATMPPKD